jgi:putative tricarboxylic transport membrane protein
MIPVILGLFAIGQMIKLAVTGKIVTDEKAMVIGSYWQSTLGGLKEIFKHKLCFFRSATIGTIVGIIPGIGGVAATYFSYMAAMQSSKEPERFGKGHPEGVIASEASNDAKDGGALLTTVAFGVPGSIVMAVLLGALVMHGLTPGPLLIRNHPDIIWALIFGLLISNFLVSTVGLLIATKMSVIARVKTTYLIPIVVVTCFIGVFMNSKNVVDIFVAIAFGFLSFGMEKYGLPLVPLAIAFVLGRLGEVFFHQSLQIAWGSYSIFFTRPISLALFILIVIIFALPYLAPLLTKRRRIVKS